ncbi:MAG: ADOP family duplicated permease [Candidatus Acidiferrales bacterium]
MRPLTNWFRRKSLERDLDRELRYHFDRLAGDLERSGLSAEEARRQATLELRGVAQIQEEVRDIWFTRWLRDLAYDLRFSLRSFLRTPSFTLTAVLSLMLGIGATTAIYSLVDQIVLHALPVRQPGRLVLIDWQGDQVANGFGSWNLMSYPICRDLDKQKQFFEGVFCRALTRIDLSTGGDARPATAEIISGNYFTVLGVGPALGQVITRDNDHAPNAVAVLSYDFWQTQLGGASDVVGRKVVVNRHPLTVIGIAAQTFRGIDVGQVPSLWIPASMSTEAIPGFSDLYDRRTRWMQVLGRLKQDMTLQRAEVGLQAWFKAMLREDVNRASFPVVTPERRQRFLNSSLKLTAAPQGHSSLRRQVSEPLWILFAVTTVLLGLACLNVSGLFLARASAREREIATRLALGASGGRLGRQLLVDSLLIAIVGGMLGIAAAPLAVRVLIAFLPKDTSANALRAGIDSRLLLFALLVTAAAGILSGLAPAWQSARRSLTSSFRERGGGTSFGGVRLRKIIVTAQVALALTLVVGAALFAGSLHALIEKGPGFVTSSLVSFGIDATRDGYSTPEGERLVDRIDEAIQRSPITQASAIARFALLTGGSWNDPMTIFADQRMETDRDVNLNAVTPGFFETMGIKIVAGRNFNDQDVAPSNNPGYRSAIVSESFVKRYLGSRNPIGVRISEGAGPNVKPKMEIVGVMSDFSYRGIREESEQAYFPFYEGEYPVGTFYVKVRGTPKSSFSSLRALVRDADPTMPVTDFRTLDDQVNRSLNTERMLATLSGSFSTLALLLSLLGLYGVMSFVVARRRREIGIRLALGASPLSAIWLMFRDALAMILAGVAAGAPFVWAFGQIVKSQLYEVKPWDPAVITIAVLALCLTGLCATLFPAYRASRIDPAETLRSE